MHLLMPLLASLARRCRRLESSSNNATSSSVGMKLSSLSSGSSTSSTHLDDAVAITQIIGAWRGRHHAQPPYPRMASSPDPPQRSEGGYREIHFTGGNKGGWPYSLLTQTLAMTSEIFNGPANATTGMNHLTLRLCSYFLKPAYLLEVKMKWVHRTEPQKHAL